MTRTLTKRNVTSSKLVPLSLVLTWQFSLDFDREFSGNYPGKHDSEVGLMMTVSMDVAETDDAKPSKLSINHSLAVAVKRLHVLIKGFPHC